MPHLNNHRRYHYISALFLAFALAATGFVVRAASPQAIQTQVQNQPVDQPAIGVFKGKILSQNGEQFILRDDVNETWYHLDDQQRAGKFLGKIVSVTGILDQTTDTIRVRSINEADA